MFAFLLVSAVFYIGGIMKDISYTSTVILHFNCALPTSKSLPVTDLDDYPTFVKYQLTAKSNPRKTRKTAKLANCDVLFEGIIVNPIPFLFLFCRLHSPV